MASSTWPPCNPGDNEYYCRAKKSYDIVYNAYLKPVDAVYDCIVNGNCPPPLDM